jgi:uroporphyrinogen decarboxylase
MIEGKPTRNFKNIKTMLYSNPKLLENLLELLSDAVSTYLKMQIRAGAQAIQIFDTWGGILPVHLYRRYSANYMKKIVQQLKPLKVPVTLFSRGGLSYLLQLRDSSADMLGVDWLTDMGEAKRHLDEVAALQGNLDPTALYGSHEIIKQEVDKILDVFGSQSGHVFNLGHGILPDIPVDNVYFLVDYIRQRSSALHGQR